MMKQITVYLPVELLTRIDKLAKEMQWKRNYFVNKMMEKYVEELEALRVKA